MACSGCSTSYNFTVDVNRSGQVVIFNVVADSCCLLTESKMIKSVLADAICQYISANVVNFPTVDKPQMYDKCCDCDAFSNMTWNFGAKSVSWTLQGSASSLPNSVLHYTVSTPYAVLNY